MGKKTSGKKGHEREKNKNDEVMNEKEGDVKKKKNKCQGVMVGDDGIVFNDGIDGEAGREREQLDRLRMEEVENQRKEKKRKKNKQPQGDKVGDDDTVFHDGIDGEAGREMEQLDRIRMEEVENWRKEKTRKKKNKQCQGDKVCDGDTVFNNGIEGEAGKEREQLDGIRMEEAENWRKEKKRKKRSKQCQGDKVGDDDTVFNDGIDGEAGREMEQLDGIRMEEVDNRRKEKNRRRKEHKDDAEKLHEVNCGVEDIVDNESSGRSSRNEAGCRNKEEHTVPKEDGKKWKKRKAQSVEKLSNDDKNVPRIKKGIEPTDPSENSTQTERSKKVSFSDHVQVFPSSDGLSNVTNAEDDGLVRGKRFSLEEDEMIRKAVTNYIEAHGLGEEGLNMVLHCKYHPEVRNCWKEIGVSLPWRPCLSIYYRAHILFERDENRKWTPEELELVRKFHEKHGSDWKMLADAIGKHRIHVKDAWRRIKLPNQKKGHWSQEEYQKLFDLVNMDLRLKAFEEKKSMHGMLRDNISWEAISDKLETRTNAICCQKWYDQLTSPMVAEGKWADTDDYHLVNALSGLDACCMDDVDWDNLLQHRSGTICRKRWSQMVKHLGPDGNKSFPEQVEILSARYYPDVLEAREAYNSRLQLNETTLVELK